MQHILKTSMQFQHLKQSINTTVAKHARRHVAWIIEHVLAVLFMRTNVSEAYALCRRKILNVDAVNTIEWYIDWLRIVNQSLRNYLKDDISAFRVDIVGKPDEKGLKNFKAMYLVIVGNINLPPSYSRRITGVMTCAIIIYLRSCIKPQRLINCQSIVF